MENLYEKCITCKEEFTDKNVHSEDGWRETQMSGLCEVCFDELFIDKED